MNLLERTVDAIDPGLSVLLRRLKHRRTDPVPHLLARLAAPGATVVDVGAHRGRYATHLSSVVGRHGTVHAVEPYPRNVAALRTIARRRRNIVVHPVAVSDHDGRADLVVPLHRGRPLDALPTLHPVSAPSTETVPVPVRRLDSLRFGSRPVTLLKIDVEGYEDTVFDGARTLIGRDRPTVVVEAEYRHRHTSPEAVFARFDDLGYDGYFLATAGLRPISEFDLQRHQLDHLREREGYSMPVEYVGDFLFVPAGAPLP